MNFHHNIPLKKEQSQVEKPGWDNSFTYSRLPLCPSGTLISVAVRQDVSVGSSPSITTFAEAHAGPIYDIESICE